MRFLVVSLGLLVGSWALVPRPGPGGWGAGDERGNGNTQGYGTRLRCAVHLIDPQAKQYELGYEFSQTMPQALFGDGPATFNYTPTIGLPFTGHAGNGETFCGGLGSQGTQMDALGHFGTLPSPWIPPAGPFPAESAVYYNGFTQAQVKPDPNGPMAKLGIEKAPPIMTTAVMLDIAALRGRTLNPGELITADDLKEALKREGLKSRGILSGDAVYVHTGYGSLWRDPANGTSYYMGGPGLSVDAQAYLQSKDVVLIALDNPFTDPFQACELDGSCPPPAGTAPGYPFAIHMANLTHGIHQIQNLKLDELAQDGTYLSCTVILPLRLKGAAGSAVRPIAIGRPR